MKTNDRQKTAKPWRWSDGVIIMNDGFAILLQPDTNLGLAMLIAEDEDGTTQPVAVASTISEAREMAQSDMRGRKKRPHQYKLWAQGVDGRYILAATIGATELLP